MESIDLFNGIIRITPIIFSLDLILIIHFLYSYYKYCYKKGFKIDPWHWGMFMPYFVATLVLYPFEGSPFNELTIGTDIYRLQPMIDSAFLITVCGYLSGYLGFYYFVFNEKKHKNDLLYLITNTISSKLAKLIQKIINNKYTMYTLSIIVIILALIITGIVVMRYGVTLNLRLFALGDQTFRPIFNFVYLSVIPTVSSFIIIRYMKTREIKLIVVFITILMVTAISGVRSAILGPILMVVVLYSYYQKRRLSLFKFFVIGITLMVIAVVLQSLRSGGDITIDNLVLGFWFSTFYGNNFSDIRDFAWILSYWDSEYILGKSYLAGLISFIPRSFSDFREVWSISVYTTQTLVGMDETHAGLRPGEFGEAYLNFGFIGVILLGFVNGYLLKYIDFKIKENVNSKSSDYVVGYSYTFANIFIKIFCMSAAAWSIYVFFGSLLFAYCIYVFFANKRFRWS